MSWTKRVKHPSEVLKKGDTVKARITNIDVGNQRVSLSIKEFLPNEWDNFVDRSTTSATTLDGKVVNVTDFGLFIDIYEGLEGLAHISEIDLPGGRLEDHYRVGDWVSARILRIEEAEKKVGLTMRGVPQPDEAEKQELEAASRQGGEEAAAEATEEAAPEAPAEEAAAEATEEAAAEATDEAAAEATDETAAEATEEVAAEATEEAAAEATEEAAAEEAPAEEASEEAEPAAEAAAEATEEAAGEEATADDGAEAASEEEKTEEG